jgi:hypothetical protein
MLSPSNQLVALAIVAVAVAVVLILLIAQMISLHKFKKRVLKFLDSGKDPKNLEAMLLDYLDVVNSIDRKYESIEKKLDDMDGRLARCVSKVSMVRYNPFKEMGGDLCFALALLDEQGNGVVLNGIHSRESSYTYCKPVSNKISSYNLSDEERKVIEMASKS